MRFGALALALVLARASHAVGAEPATQPGPATEPVPATQPVATTQSEPATQPSFFRDPEDGYFDVSNFLSTRVGFLPIAMPITEPAVGYGLGLGFSFCPATPQAVT